jgi:hypothetical protein
MSLSGSGEHATEELYQAVLDRIMDGEALSAICRQKGFPSKKSFLQRAQRDEAFAKRYAEAMRIRTMRHEHEILEIADSTTAENWQQNRLRIDTRKFILVHLLPEKYGDKVKLEHSGGVTVNASPVDQAL